MRTAPTIDDVQVKDLMQAAGQRARVLVDTCGWVDFLRSSSGMLGECVRY